LIPERSRDLAFGVLVLQIRDMTIADIPAGMHLKEQAGWNQLEADWRRLLDLQPDGCFIAEWEGIPAGTVTTCRFGPVAWIAMMLVDERFRNRGIGRALMTHALHDLDTRGVRTIRLDATPLGRPLYESLGFIARAEFARFQGVLPSCKESQRLAEASSLDLLDAIAELDRKVTGTDRARLLRRLAADHPGSLHVVRQKGNVAGFLMARPGARARQVGPCIADERAGPLLFADARKRYAGESVFLDIPTSHESAGAIAASWGLNPGRLLTRMDRGPRVVEHLEQLWTSAGPEKG
jgi:GNAT superfamily N-acetyltransferase